MYDACVHATSFVRSSLNLHSNKIHSAFSCELSHSVKTHGVTDSYPPWRIYVHTCVHAAYFLWLYSDYIHYSDMYSARLVSALDLSCNSDVIYDVIPFAGVTKGAKRPRAGSRPKLGMHLNMYMCSA